MSAPGLIIAAPASGSGKTTVTLALLRALRRAGSAVGSFKVGPDYIDPMFHARASGRPCPNLDGWAMRIETLAGLADALAKDVALVLGEGGMGLFDGAADGRGSTADLASLLDLPVVLVVDARGMAASAAALVEGFTRHRDDVEVAGIMPFSPLADEPPDASADAVFLPGGYPELHAPRLAGNQAFIRGLRAGAERGASVYGECGGFMVLGQAPVDRQGESHAMAGPPPIP